MSLRIKEIGNDTEEGRLLHDLFATPDEHERLVEIGEQKFVLPIHVTRNWDTVNQFEVRDDDVFIAGHPRSGTTVIHDMIDLIVNNFDMKRANISNVYRLLLSVDPLVVHHLKRNLPSTAERSDLLRFTVNAKSPRCIGSHLPWFLLPEQIQNGSKTPMIVLCLRNPKDTCISYYHIMRSIGGYLGNFEDFCKLFLAGKLIHGSYFTTVRSYWEKINQPNILCVRYSDIVRDLSGTIRRTAAAFGKVPTDEQINEMVGYLSFDSWKQHTGKALSDMLSNISTTSNIPSVHTDFARAGVEGGFSSVMSQELVEKFDKKTKQEFLGLDISFD